MKKLKLFVMSMLAVIVAFSLSGCLRSLQLNERALVQALGIDIEGDKVKLTLQVYSPTSAGVGGISSSSENAKIIETTGETVSIAIQNATLIQGKKLFMGQNKILILGNEIAKKGVIDVLEYFSSSATTRSNLHLVVAKGTANEILKTKINQGILPAETLEKIVDNTDENGLLKSIKLYEFLTELENRHESSALPIMEIIKENKKQGNEKKESSQGGGKPAEGEGEGGGEEQELTEVSSIGLTGMAVFSNGKMIGELDSTESRGILWFQNKIDKTTVLTQTDSFSLVTAKIFHSKSKIIPHIKGDKIVFELKIKCKATINETQTKPGVEVDTEDILAVGAAIEGVIKNECETSFNKAIREYKADLFDLGDIVWKADIELWRVLHDNWEEKLDDISFVVTPVVQIERAGLEISLN